MQERSRSLTFQPGEILNNAASIFFFFFFTHLGPPSRENCGGVFTYSATPAPPPRGRRCAARGRRVWQGAPALAVFAGSTCVKPRRRRPGWSFSGSMVRGFIFRSTHMLSSTPSFALIELFICTPCCWQLNGTIGRPTNQRVLTATGRQTVATSEMIHGVLTTLLFLLQFQGALLW